MTDAQETREARYWRTAPELPPEVFSVWRKPSKALNPIAIVATVGADGAPHTAPFGSVRAVTPRLLRLLTWRGHDTYANLCRDGRVMVTLVAPPDVAVGVQGHARVARERMITDEYYAIVDIDVEQVKNDLVRSIVIDSAIMISPREEFEDWFDAVIGEIEDL